ncbi:MAG: VWA domain-containing protein, partial [Bacteroidota bacterium]
LCLPSGIGESLEAMRAAEEGLIQSQDLWRYSLKALFCNEEEEGPVFDLLFDQYWGKEKMAVGSRVDFFNQSNLIKKGQGSVVMLGKGESEGEEQESKQVSGANGVERLTTTDFAKLNEVDSDMLEELAEELWRQMSMRLRRKFKAAKTHGPVDLRKTIRQNITNGGIPIDLRRRKKLLRKPRLIVLLDVSGSMDKYSFFLLRFVCALKQHFEKIEAFLFSTRLIRISDHLEAHDLARTLVQLSAQANNWSSGTRIGECLRTFNEAHARSILAGHSTTIILSDGLDTGLPEVLAEQVNAIKLRTRRLIWLNPLKGMEGYQPIQRGMKAALPEVDVFESAHNLASLLALEKYLEYV